MERGRVGDGEGSLVGAAVTGDGEGMGATVGAKSCKNGVAWDAVPKILCRVADIGMDDGYDTSVAATRTSW